MARKEEIVNTFFEDPERYSLCNLSDHILSLQAECSWPTEAEALERHGLILAKKNLDIGTGNGAFLCRMAERHPEKQFIGIETNKERITRAQHTAKK
ncbi:MAG TPA: hypothetical protein DD381_10895 [Lentisphaeria bacterium]|nr:MAG: hypothetical protein A2X47_00705 [Lentisphaerae bacterium GWF2_38_69]HBM16834.1 hypothetical protein [Lentisphaeria bacterium]